MTRAPTPAAPPASPPARPLLAALWMTGAIAAFTSMAVATRAITAVHDTFEILAFRSIIGIALVVGCALALGRLAELRTRRLPTHVLRNMAHFTGQALWFWAVTQIPLAQVFALEFTSPIWVILLSPLFLGERLTLARLGCAALGLAGVMVVARPDFAAPDAGIAAAAACALFFAISIIMTKRLTRGETILTILFWLTVLQALFGLGLSLADGGIALPTAATLPWLALIGLAGVGAHLCLTTALSLAPASTVVPLDFARLPLIAVIGWALYEEALDLPVVIGAAMILTANFLNLRLPAGAGKSQPPVTSS